MLDVKNLSVKYGELKILDDVSFSVGQGQWVMIVGPNGAGKSTIVNAISRGASYAGTILYEGRDLKTMKASEAARHIGILSQNSHVGYAFTVEEIIRLGRYAYSKGPLSSQSMDDESHIERALSLTGLDTIRKQSVLTLSGGERQRTFLAQVLAQNPDMLILDEPTNHLDLIYQKSTFEMIRSWVAESGRAVISVVHDLSLAKAFGTHALLLNKGRLISSGTSGEVLTREKLCTVYDMDVYGWMSEMLSQWREE